MAQPELRTDDRLEERQEVFAEIVGLLAGMEKAEAHRVLEAVSIFMDLNEDGCFR